MKEKVDFSIGYILISLWYFVYRENKYYYFLWKDKQPGAFEVSTFRGLRKKKGIRIMISHPRFVCVVSVKFHKHSLGFQSF